MPFGTWPSSLRSCWLVFVLIVAPGGASAIAAPSAAIEGTAVAKDGDDVVVNGIDIRLQGIAAPEDNGAKRELGGPESTASLHAIVDGKILRCEPDGTTARGRPVAVCFLGGRDVGKLQVLAGHARDCPRYSHGRYSAAESEARAGGRDLSAIYPLPRYCFDR